MEGFDFRLILAVFLSDSKDALYTELWLACAGPLVTIPRVGEKVFYFPQGHIEQVSTRNQVSMFASFGGFLFGCFGLYSLLVFFVAF